LPLNPSAITLFASGLCCRSYYRHQGVSIRILVGITGVALILVVLWEGFETMMLPRRVVRRVRLTWIFYRNTWIPWSRIAGSVCSGRRLESLLGVYGPLSLLFLIFLWVAVIIAGFGLVHWALGSTVSDADGARGFWVDLYMSGTTFFTLGLGDVRPVLLVAKVITVMEAGMGFGFLALVVGYFPTLSQSFSRREASISKLDSRAGSPPVGVLMLRKHNHQGGMEELRERLFDWEQWCAELLESHISYPVLAYYRSQHDNQSWLAALTAVLDTSALLLVGPENTCSRQAGLTFAMARHAVVDIAAVFNRPPKRPARDRLPEKDHQRLRSMLAAEGDFFAGDEVLDARLASVRATYEPYISSLAEYFRLALPPWVPDPDRLADWQTSPWERNPASRGE
jgi:hypothetical protein